MSVLNVTPDSYFEPSQNPEFTSAVETGLRHASQGADIIDIGGESSRPQTIYKGKTVKIDAEEEMRRVIPVIKDLTRQISVPLSIDTVKPEVADAAVKAGAAIINDIEGFRNPKMCEVAAFHDVDICIMHMQGTPQTMQINPSYPQGVIKEILEWFHQQIDLLHSYGIKNERIILDPGIGFGKTVAHNLEIIHNLPQIRALGFPVLIGASRKQFMREILKKPTEQLLPSTIAVNTIALMNGVDVIRVHDVVEHRDLIDFFVEYKNL